MRRSCSCLASVPRSEGGEPWLPHFSSFHLCTPPASPNLVTAAPQVLIVFRIHVIATVNTTQLIPGVHPYTFFHCNFANKVVNLIKGVQALVRGRV